MSSIHVAVCALVKKLVAASLHFEGHLHEDQVLND